ncbi:MAG: DUF1993 domain-containing protein [Brachymonas sp.]|nr:DUF1993 domain-containing protein [Brachymonas sp.]
MHSASSPIFKSMLGNLDHFLAKAAAHAEAKKFDPANLLAARLAPDMLPFTRQVLIACDASKLCMARLAGMEAPKYEDNETTIEQLRERIAKTIAFIDSVPASAIDGTEDKDITFPVGRDGATRTMKGEAYLKHWALANMFFHVTTAYALLRHNGVELGKSEYLLGARAGQ